MSFVGWARRCAIGILLCVSMSGCFPMGDSQTDEKKEPNFISGKNLVGQMDYQGAINAFEKALEVNPRSASAHFELGWLCEERANDPAAAIYHYERYLKFSSNPGNADVVRQIINRCKLELAKTVSAMGPLASPAQRELERLALENRDLQTRVEALQSQLDQAKAAAARAQTRAVASDRNPAPNPNPARATPNPARAESPRAAAESPGVAPGKRPAVSAAVKTHTIKAGDTPIAIARQYGISVSALLAANPTVKPTHLWVGQTLNIPAP